MAYETELDRQHEAEIARKLGDAWGVEFLHWPEFAQVDLIGYHNQRPTHMVEIKARNIPFTKYDTWSYSKKSSCY